MAPPLIVRDATALDTPQLLEVHRLAFAGDDEATLVAALLADGDAVVSSLAETGGQVVGHVLLSAAAIVDGDTRVPCLALAPMAVRPSSQRQGIGSQLVEHALQRARDLGHVSVLVLGHPAYYPRFGFVPASRWAIRCPYDAPDEAFLALPLRPGALDGVRGMIEYAPAFAAL